MTRQPKSRVKGSTVTTLESLADEVRPILNDLCCCPGRKQIVRLLGVREADGRLWYVVCDRDGMRSYISAVFACTSMRTELGPERYAALDGMFRDGGGGPVDTMVVDRKMASTPHDWLGTLRNVLSNLGLSAPESDETLAADLDNQMQRVLLEVVRQFGADSKTPPGYRLQPFVEFDATNKLISEHADIAALLRRVAHALERRDPGNATASRAKRYLERIGEAGRAKR